MSEERGEMRRSDEGVNEDVEEVVLLETRPIEPGDVVLRDKFFEQYAEQAEQMDALGRQMITVELAVPGIYAAVLALLQGQDATLGNG